MNCTEARTNSDHYFAYAVCEEPMLVLCNVLWMLVVALCLCFGASRSSYQRVGP